MNCCDDYGNCRQGRDCPVRRARELERTLNEVPGKHWAVALAIIAFVLVTVYAAKHGWLSALS